MKRWLVPAGCAALMGAAQLACAEGPELAPSSKQPNSAASDERKTIYEMGVLLSRGLDTFQLSDAEFEALKSGLSDGFHQRAGAAEANAWMPRVQALQHDRVAIAAQHEKEAGQVYLAKAAQAPGAKRLPGGLLYVSTAPGAGASPLSSDEVRVNYEGRLIDGTVFDSSIKHGKPADLNVAGVIPCWSEALQIMKVGGKSRIICPSDLAYGEHGALPLIKPGATLEFDIELLEVHPHSAAPDADDAAAGASKGK